MPSDEQTALDTWDVCQSKLRPALQGKLEPIRGGPKVLNKHGGDIMRLRILPIGSERLPSRFWDAAWCLYEIGVGKYPNQSQGLCLGGIQFFQFSDNGECSHGAYHDRLLQLLKDIQLKRSTEFQLETHSGYAPKPGRKPSLARYYHAKPFKIFPVQTAGEDLAWLISETLPAIQRFTDSP